MPKLKWGGIIDDIAKYQTSALPDNASKLKMPSTVGEMMRKAFPFAIPAFMVLFLSVFLKVRIQKDFVIVRFAFLLGFLVGLFLMLLHEVLHAVVYPSDATVTIGIIPKQIAAVALASYPLKRRRFILMSLLPYILGIIPLILFWLMPDTYPNVSGFLFGLSATGLVSPYPDSYNVYQALKQTKKGDYLQFYGDDLYSFRCIP